MIEIIQNFFIGIWDAIVSVIKLLSMFIFTGFETEVTKNCIPQLEYKSSQKIVFILKETIDRTWADKGYDSLSLLNTDTYYLTIDYTSKHTYTGYFVDILPSGTILKLTGNILRREPYGIIATNNSSRIYLEGIILNKRVWLPIADLSYFNESIIAKNIENNKIINFPLTYKDRETWTCSI